jgi:protochlorophyllide reductase
VQTAADLAYLATAPELTGVSGTYFRERQATDSSAESYERDKADDLWRTSIKLGHLRPGKSLLLDDTGTA